ncbi:MAG: PorT family protein [Chitinophagales bacterium]|nr:PorT family protein [Chitinophagales bacterium]
MSTKILFLVFLMQTINLCSQDPVKKSIFFGGRLGLSTMYVTESAGSLKADYDNRTGINTALFFEFELGKHFSFQPELNFTNKGYKFNQGQSVNVKLNYLELPLILKPKIPLGENFEIYGDIGPSFSLGLGGEAIVNNRAYGDLFGDGGYRSFDLGLNYGGGFNVKLSSGYKFGLGIRFFKGLSELYPPNSGGSSGFGSVSGRNNGFIVGFSLMNNL